MNTTVMKVKIKILQYLHRAAVALNVGCICACLVWYFWLYSFLIHGSELLFTCSALAEHFAFYLFYQICWSFCALWIFCTVVRSITLHSRVSIFLEFVYNHCTACSSDYHKFWWFLLAVYPCNWYMEHRLYLCWGSYGEAALSWKKCSSPTGFNDWSAWNAFNGYNFSCMWIQLTLRFWQFFLKTCVSH